HTYTGHGALTIQKKEGLTTDKNNTITAPPTTGDNGNTGGSNTADTQELRKNLVIAHGILMTIAFLFIFPIGAMLVRFFANVHSVFRWHRPLQVTGFLTVVAALVCIIVAVYKKPDGPPPISESTHATLGVILASALVIQIGVGIFIFHTFDPSISIQRTFHRVTTLIHRCWGYSILIVGAYQIKLGIDKYGMWPTGKESVWYIYYVWVGVVAAVFVLGSLIKLMRGRKSEVHNQRYSSDNKAFGSRQREEDQYELQQNRRGSR
ncbi:hypothetical protein BGZ76_003649, partial [Entomortierella beljakovae]